ncbi:membrane protein [Vibrio sp. qd031]|uniref:regulatory protein ToxS n=1 Tax=Vibrio sp. qd031 TaxID=1603038 RepID=UPI000A118595|nr:regulatory protein ToxS [Vibrio sp. qd031]ORT50411.1 membrane protein [Vibrio sp. qd031]
MNKRVALIILFASAIISSWIYWGSDVKVEQVLTSREWQTHLITHIHADLSETELGQLSKVSINSNVKYLPTGQYLRVSRMELMNEESEQPTIIEISESGLWQLSDNYLLVDPQDFKDSSSVDNRQFTDKQLTLIKQIFVTDAEQSRRVDIISDNAILLTSLGHGSQVLVSN